MRPFVHLAVAMWLCGAGVQSAFAQYGAKNGEWRSYAADSGSTKYSPLDQINKDNFSQLRIAWRWKTADRFLSKTDASGGEWFAPHQTIIDEIVRETPKLYRDGNSPSLSNLQATPLMVGGRLFLNTALSQGVALDARTGETLWVFNPKSYEEGTTSMTVTWRQRGVAYWTDGKAEHIFWGTGNGCLVCVDAKTGQPCGGFGENGRVDAMKDLPHANRGDRDYLNALLYSIQSGSPPDREAACCCKSAC